MVHIYCENSTPRVEYIFNFILNVVCGFTYEITSDVYDYCSYNGPTLNYSSKNLKQNDIQIQPNGLLFLSTICACKGHIEEEKKNTSLFLKGPGLDENCFDLFAAAFYLITRYEEYLDYVPDVYDRFEASASLMFQYNVLIRPLINEWAEALKQQIIAAYPNTPFQKRVFDYKISIDLDQAFAFRNRGIARNLISLSKNLTQFNMMFLKSQVKTLLSKNDPYDTFTYLKQFQEEHALPFIYFINVGAYSKYDKNLPAENKSFKKVLNTIKEHAEIGLHPSYFSNTMPHKFKEEKEALEQAIQRPVTQSRQHYLKLQLPQTYQHLLAIGIMEDYSMGYASYPGFRAGTCTPFTWFDLQKNISTTLKIFPVTYMENAFAEDLHMSPEQALQFMQQLTDTVYFHNGFHSSIWHNHTVNDVLLWKGWKAVFEKSIQHIISLAC